MRNAIAVLAGLVIAIGLMIGSNIQLVKFMPATAPAFLAISLALAAVIHLLSGYTCAAIARDHGGAVLALVVLGTGVLLTSVHQTWHQMPVWYSVTVAIEVPLMLWLGAQAHRPSAASTPTRRPT